MKGNEEKGLDLKTGLETRKEERREDRRKGEKLQMI